MYENKKVVTMTQASDLPAVFFLLGVKIEKTPVKKVRYFAILGVKKQKAPVKISENWRKSGREKHFLPVKIWIKSHPWKKNLKHP